MRLLERSNLMNPDPAEVEGRGTLRLSHGWLPEGVYQASGQCYSLAHCLRAAVHESHDILLIHALLDRAEELEWAAEDLAGGRSRPAPVDTEPRATWLESMFAPLLKGGSPGQPQFIRDFAVATWVVRAHSPVHGLLNQLRWVAGRLELIDLVSDLSLHLQRWTAAIEDFERIANRLFTETEDSPFQAIPATGKAVRPLERAPLKRGLKA